MVSDVSKMLKVKLSSLSFRFYSAVAELQLSGWPIKRSARRN